MILEISLQKSESERSEHYLCFFILMFYKWKKNNARFAQIFAVVYMILNNKRNILFPLYNST